MQDKLNRRTFLGGIAAAVAGTAALTGETAAHYVSQPVYSTTDLIVRDGPGPDNDPITTIEQYTGGFVIDGPVDADGYRWWRYRWNDDCEDRCITGWAAGEDTSTAHANLAYPMDGCISSEYYSEDGDGYYESIDIENTKYTNVYASRGGYHTQHYASEYGNYSVIDHGGGYETLYAHLVDWVAGDGVNVGTRQHIAEMGFTGNVAPQYLRFQVHRDGDPLWIPGAVGDGLCAWTGVPKTYAGLSRF